MKSLFMQKKGAAGLFIPIVVVLALFVIISQGFSLIGRECSKDKDCKSTNDYCGSDFKCHPHPVITKINYIPAALIIAGGLVVAAIILRGKKQEYTTHRNKGGQ